jgi:hypothetical protein
MHRTTKGLSQDGDEIFGLSEKNVQTNLLVTFPRGGGDAAAPCPSLNTALVYFCLPYANPEG